MIRFRTFASFGIVNAGQPGGRTIVTCVSDGPTDIFVTAVDTSGNESDRSNTDTFDCSL